MAGVAGHLAMSVEAVSVDGEHHLHHFARSLLRLFVVFLESILDVTEIALDSERCRDELHGGKDLVRRDALQHLYVLELLLSFLLSGLWCRFRACGRGGSATERVRSDQQNDCAIIKTFSHRESLLQEDGQCSR